MKRRDFLKLAPLGLVSCTGLQSIMEENPDLAKLTIETLVIPIGYYGGEHAVVDTALRSVYSMAVSGTLTPDALNAIIKAVNPKDALQVLLVAQGIQLIQLAGATVINGSVVSIAGLNSVYIQAAASGYVKGFNAYKAAVA